MNENIPVTITTNITGNYPRASTVVDSAGTSEAMVQASPSEKTKPKQVGSIKPVPQSHNQQQAGT